MSALCTRPLGVPMAIPDETLHRAIDYCLRGYSAERVAEICGIRLSHARLIKLGSLRK